MLDDYVGKWKLLFDMANLGTLTEPLSPRILSDPTHKIVRHLLYLYTMESFIYPEMNRACRKKDRTKIKYYGAYAAALSYIIYYANTKRSINSKTNRTTTLYRGVALSPSEADSYVPSSTINLLGYTSTSKSMKCAIKFAFMEKKPELTPVVFEIQFRGRLGFFELSQEYSAYPEE